MPLRVPGGPDIDACVGDYALVPTRNPHTFSNLTDGAAKLFGTCAVCLLLSTI